MPEVCVQNWLFDGNASQSLGQTGRGLLWIFWQQKLASWRPIDYVKVGNDKQWCYHKHMKIYVNDFRVLTKPNHGRLKTLKILLTSLSLAKTDFWRTVCFCHRVFGTYYMFPIYFHELSSRWRYLNILSRTQITLYKSQHAINIGIKYNKYQYFRHWIKGQLSEVP